MSERVRLAMIGCGGMAGGHLRAYHEIIGKHRDLVEIVACCDAEESRARQFSESTAVVQGKAPVVYTDYLQMLEETAPTAADIVTPHSEHHLAAVACLEAGVHVQVEKPIGITVRATRRIIEAARKSGKIAATAENVRRGLSQRTAHWLINERKALGTPRQFFSQSASWQEPAPTEHRSWVWRADALFGGGGMVMDSGAHYCDTLQYLFGPVETVFASVRQFDRRPRFKGEQQVMDEREDSWVAVLQFASGLVGTWSWSIAAPGHAFTNVVYYGSEASLLDHGDVFHGPFGSSELIDRSGKSTPMSQFEGEFLEHLGPQGQERLFPHGWRDGVVLECYDFLQAIQQGGQPEVDAEAGLRAKGLCEAIYESGASNKVVQMKDVLDGTIEEYQRPINDHWRI